MSKRIGYDYEPIERFIYVKCKNCGTTISLDYEGQFNKCPWCNSESFNKQ